jgi:hypothetical protein
MRGKNDKKPTPKLVVAHCGPWGEPQNVATTGPAVAGYCGEREMKMDVPECEREGGELSQLIQQIQGEVNEAVASVRRLCKVLWPITRASVEKESEPCDGDFVTQTEIGLKLATALGGVRHVREAINDLAERVEV